MWWECIRRNWTLRALALRVLFAAYPNIVHLLSLQGSGIRSISDLAGKRVALEPRLGHPVAALNVERFGFEQRYCPALFELCETTSGLKDGTLDAGFVVGGLGIAAVTELAVTRDIEIIVQRRGNRQPHKQFPAYSAYEIPGDTYAGVSESRQALGIWSAVVVHESCLSLGFSLTCTVYRDRTLAQRFAGGERHDDSQCPSACRCSCIRERSATSQSNATAQVAARPLSHCRMVNRAMSSQSFPRIKRHVASFASAGDKPVLVSALAAAGRFLPCWKHALRECFGTAAGNVLSSHPLGLDSGARLCCPSCCKRAGAVALAGRHRHRAGGLVQYANPEF